MGADERAAAEEPQAIPFRARTMHVVSKMHPDLCSALTLAGVADAVTLRWWSRDGVPSRAKADGSPVTSADVEAERAILGAVLAGRPDDGFLGEEVGARLGSTGRRWIVDGIDGTSSYAAGLPTWGTMIALEQNGEIMLGVVSSPAQDRRWWARRGDGAFTGTCASEPSGRSIRVSTSRQPSADRALTLPLFDRLRSDAQIAVVSALGCRPYSDAGSWSQQMKVAEGEVDLCIWYCGDVWDHAAPSVIVEEAGGSFSDHEGGRRLDTRTAIYSNGACHESVLTALMKQ